MNGLVSMYVKRAGEFVGVSSSKVCVCKHNSSVVRVVYGGKEAENRVSYCRLWGLPSLVNWVGNGATAMVHTKQGGGVLLLVIKHDDVWVSERQKRLIRFEGRFRAFDSLKS